MGVKDVPSVALHPEEKGIADGMEPAEVTGVEELELVWDAIGLEVLLEPTIADVVVVGVLLNSHTLGQH